ncbi:(S)-ureidoglycine aminohydrolase, cupin domain [Dillenia turbinata]|uniref:(S)-ureidoglycine aminohydrolase, cupin domain n=1 Tax=Dillenia turbinata TaxID=194707 RepID=A0AAN8VPM8_9MAGN
MAADSNLRIIVERNPSKSKLQELGINSWPKWGCSPGKYQLRFDAEETCYVQKGKVKVYPKGSPESEYVEFGAGRPCNHPQRTYCTWDVLIAVDKVLQI